MKKWCLGLVTAALLASGTGWAQDKAAGAATSPATSPVGLWKTVDDKSGEVRGEVRLFETDGMIYGRIERIFDPKAIGQRCTKCNGDRKDQPIQGLSVIRGVHPDGPGYWSGGEILDPETGDTYRVTLRLEDDGRKLVVRGSILGGMIGRSQTWQRAKT